MLLGNKEFENKFEKAIRLLVKHVPVEPERKKQIIPHCLRVGFYLYERDYSEDVVLGGLLHDIIEWTESSESLVRDEFGENVYGIVMANTQNREIGDKVEQWKDMVDRCVANSEDALIVKTADVLDSYAYYTAARNQDEITRSTSIGKYMLEKLPEGLSDPIFSELKRRLE